MKKKTVSLKKALLFNLGVLLCVGLLLFQAELSVVSRKQKEILLQKTSSMKDSFVSVHYANDYLQHLCDDLDSSSARILAYLYDLDGRPQDIGAVLQELDITGLYFNQEGLDKSDYASYYEATASDGTLITTETYSSLYSYAQRFVITEARIVNDALASEDLFIVVNSNDGTVRNYYQRPGSTIEDSQIPLDNLTEDTVEWMNINGKYYYVSRAYIELGYTTLFIGISLKNMLAGPLMAFGLIFALICLIIIVLTIFVYYSRQQLQKNEDTKSSSYRMITRKVSAYSLISILLLGLTAYYIQSLLNVSIYSMNAKDEIQQLQKAHEETRNSESSISSFLDLMRTSHARQISHVLSIHPELRTMEHLKELSDIYRFKYIMMFDKNGVETVSDSDIEDFVISDDPKSQSYPFNILKKGVPSYVQQAQESELTGEYLQYIGVVTHDNNGVRDGFLQTADTVEVFKNVTSHFGLRDLIIEAISGTSEEAFLIDADGIIRHTADYGPINDKALEVGFTEEQLRGHYYGTIKVLDTDYMATSCQLDDQLVFIVGQEKTLQKGRWAIVLASMGIGLATIIAFSLFMRNRRVTDAVEYEEDLYVDVETPASPQKSTINVLRRIMIKDIKWPDKRPEEKAVFTARFIIDVVAFIILVIMLVQKNSGSTNGIFSFVTGNRWDKGINLFAFTTSLIAVMIVYLVLTVIEYILYVLMSLSNPRNETVIRLIRSFIKYVSVLGLIYYALNQFGFDSRSLLASAGLLTLVVGLGAKDLVTDILAGMFLIFENEFQVGDIIEVDGYKGRVAEIGIRTTRLVSTTQDVKSINNRNLTNIVNKTRRNTFCDVIVNVPFEQSIEQLETVLNTELPLLKDHCPYILNGPTYGGVDDLGNRTMRLSIRTECLEAHKFEVKTFVNREVKRIFEEHGMKMV